MNRRIKTIGKILASSLMIIGYSVIAVPPGIVTVELAQQSRTSIGSSPTCPACQADGHDRDAAYCKRCGAALS